MDEEEVDTVIQANRYFTERLYRTISATHEENILCSPFSAHTLLALISQDPGYHKKEAFTRVLDIHGEPALAPKAYKKILALLNSGNNETFSIAFKLLFSDQCQLQEAFKNFLSNNFSCEVESLDLSKRESVVKTINSWVEEKTNKTTKDLTDASSLHDATRLVLLNTIKLSDKWSAPFNIENTVLVPFHLNDGDTVEVQMMRTKMEANYKKDGRFGVKILELPYKNDASLIIILPNKGTSIRELEDNLGYLNLVDFLDDMSKQEVDISLPKFKTSEGIDLKSVLCELDLSEELGENANLFGMIECDEFLCFDKIQQKGFIEVNEEGTEATTGIICTSVPIKADDEEDTTKNGLTIYEMDIKSNISNRFAKNLVICKIKNTEKSAKDATFTVTIPETAFITEFIMDIGGKTYKSYIKQKEEAKQIYTEAKASGKSAGIVEASARDSNEFTVSVNLEPQCVAVFSLTYEEMIQCIHDQYELVLNIRPGQIVEDLNVEVMINESKPLKFVKTPSLRSGNEISKNEKYLKPATDIKILSPKDAVVKFRPNSKEQRKISRYLGTSPSDGFSGQFVVQYSVERDPHGGEILLQDGYFVHFFAPNDLDPLPKHVVFVLDTSGSMGGRKIYQLKDSMMSILTDIRKHDRISIIEFNNEVIVWDIDAEKPTKLFYKENYEDPFCPLSEYNLPDATYANDATLKKANNVVQKITANGGTFMIGGLETALYLVKIGQKKHGKADESYQPIIVFLTDGEPNVGIRSTEKIVEIVTRLNFKNNKVPIFSLSFGIGADKKFLRNLSLKNLGFSRHIYEASDASLQLQEFYKQISSPLLSNIKFKYDSAVDEDVTDTNFPIYFKGSELVVSGRYRGSEFPTTVNCCGPRGPIILNPIFETPVTSLERLWAYLTVKQLLEKMSYVEDKTNLTKKATELALKYSFVTEVTSLVVVKPNETVSTTVGEMEEEAQEQGYIDMSAYRKLSGGFPAALCMRSMSGYRDMRAYHSLSDSSPATMCMRSRCGFLRGDQEEMKTTELKEDKPPTNEEFLADHPFLIYLKIKKENKLIVLFKGRISKPA